MIFRQETSYYTLYIYVCVHARGNPHLTAHDIIREAGRKRVVFHAVHCNPPRSALQPSPQCCATRPAVHCIRRAYLVQIQTHVLVTAPARTCVRGCKRYKPLPQTFAGKPLWRDADEYAACTSPRHIGEPSSVSYAPTCMTD